MKKNQQVLFKPVQEEIEQELIEKLKDEVVIAEITDKEKEHNELVELYAKQESFAKYEVKFHSKLEILELERQLLLPRIKRIIDKLKGRYNAEHSELAELLYCYNTFYKRCDSFTCSACVARAYDALKKLV